MFIKKDKFKDNMTTWNDLKNELEAYFRDPNVEKAFQEAISHVKSPLPSGVWNRWCKEKQYGGEKTWEECTSEFFTFMEEWFHFLASPTSGLSYIVEFCYFYYRNQYAQDFLNRNKENGGIYEWTIDFVTARGEFMDSSDSTSTINQWIEDPNTNIDDFIVPAGGFNTFNEFFTRNIRPGARPISAVEDDSIVVSPADAELNMINAPLVALLPGENMAARSSPTDARARTLDPRVSTKLNAAITEDLKVDVVKLLNGYEKAYRFAGGTALSCILLPAAYHHFHAPVTGKMIYSEVAGKMYFGLEDAPMWFHRGNVGDSDSDFTIFERFHRWIQVTETKSFGLVAMVAVGLNTISSIVIEDKFKDVSKDNPVPVYKGDKLGYFKYGGSLSMLLFEPNVFPGIKVDMGQRVGKLSGSPYPWIKADGVPITGNWSEPCPFSPQRKKEHHGDCYAQYYTFTLPESKKVQIDLQSEVDTFLYLLAGGNNPGGAVIVKNDDVGATLHSRIVQTLPEGGYTIEATTYNSKETGPFTLTLKTLSDGSS
jgi:phosphatidylserine decarboxylase